MGNLLKEKKLSATPFRKEVLAIFSRYSYAIPLSIVEQELQQYNRITLYRTIKVFLEKGIIHQINLNGEEAAYAICQEGCSTTEHHHQHIHFKCSDCNKVYCVAVSEYPRIQLPGYEIKQLEIQATGLCKNCQG